MCPLFWFCLLFMSQIWKKAHLPACYFLQVYLPSFMFVIVSWVSFLVKPGVVPGRWLFLTLSYYTLFIPSQDGHAGHAVPGADQYIQQCQRKCSYFFQTECYRFVSSGLHFLRFWYNLPLPRYLNNDSLSRSCFAGVCRHPAAAEEEEEACDLIWWGDEASLWWGGQHHQGGAGQETCE